jgi:integration host factor subunit beta
MLKSELVQRISVQYPHLYRSHVDKILDTIFDTIITTMARSDRVELRGFGVFSTKIREARIGRNPRTGVEIQVTKKVVPSFKAGLDMRERLNRREE